MFVQNPTRRYYLWSDNRKARPQLGLLLLSAAALGAWQAIPARRWDRVWSDEGLQFILFCSECLSLFISVFPFHYFFNFCAKRRRRWTGSRR